MTGPEKGYFKKNSSSDHSKYLILFGLIDEQIQNNHYDEAMVRAGFKNDSIVNNLHVAKNYLFKLILKNLVQFHSESSASISISDIYNGHAL